MKKIVGNSGQSTCWSPAVIENRSRLQGQKNRYVFNEKNGTLCIKDLSFEVQLPWPRTRRWCQFRGRKRIAVPWSWPRWCRGASRSTTRFRSYPWYLKKRLKISPWTESCSFWVIFRSFVIPRCSVCLPLSLRLISLSTHNVYPTRLDHKVGPS